MLTQIVLFGVLVSGSVLGSSVLKKRFEDILPITCAFIVLLLFLCGTMGAMKQGVYFVLAISCFLWIYSVYYVWKQKTIIQFIRFFVTPAFAIFSLAYIVLIYTNYGRLAMVWDEFSHWADIVKAMVSIDDFGTNPAAHSMFQSYPPGMSLFQYFFQKVYLLLNKGELFSEWRLYYAYQIFFLSFLMPFLRELSFENISIKKIFDIFVSAVLCCLGPMLVFDDIYMIVLIDAVLGLLAGTGAAMIFVRRRKDWCYDLYIMMNIAMLVLAKDAGMLFAIFLLLMYMIDTIFYRDISGKQRVINCIFAALATILPKLLWSYNIKSDNAYVSFSNSIELKELFKVILGLDRTSYRAEVVSNFFTALISARFEVSVFKIGIPYILLCCGVMFFVYVLYKKYKDNKKTSSIQKTILILFVSEIVIYILGLLVTYMFKFSEYEAVGLASFDRYMSIIFECMIIFLLMLTIYYISANGKKYGLVITSLILVLALVPWGMVKTIGMRHGVLASVNTRARYIPIVEQIEEIAKDSEESLKITVISQESAGYDLLILRYSLRPHLIVGAESIGKSFYEGDIYTVEVSAEEWKQELKENVDYVALYHLNDYFMEEYSCVFENPEDIREDGVYRVNKENGLLQLYEK